MASRTTIADALPRCFPLPRAIELGDQRWTVTMSALRKGRSGTFTLTVLLSGPYQRFRQVRFALDAVTLLAGGYDASRAGRAIARWLPNSDALEVLEIDGAQLLPAAHFAHPAHD